VTLQYPCKGTGIYFAEGYQSIAGEQIAFCQAKVSGFKKLFPQSFPLIRLLTSELE